MTKFSTAICDRVTGNGAARRQAAAALALATGLALAQGPAPAGWSAPGSARLHAADLGLVINTADPYSVEVGEYYAARRGLAPGQVLRVELPTTAVLSRDQLDDLRERVDAHFGPATQALALAWVTPSQVECHSITGALTLGFDEALCRQTCGRSRVSPYVNAATGQPWRDLKLRPSMLIAARSVAQAKALIDRGVAADRVLALRGAPMARAVYVATDDAARNVRAPLFPPTGRVRGANVEIVRTTPAEFGAQQRVVLAMTGVSVVQGLDTIAWAPGGLGDHLTSYGGAVAAPRGQSTVLDWIQSGAVASYGTVSEPCNHLQKFPHPQWLLRHYAAGETAIEAYWKSVAWPQQGLFVGEPLAAPFARD